MLFPFPIPRPKEERLKRPLPVFVVRGAQATSIEYYFSWALDKVGLGYLFQVDYWGGRAFAGGLVLDFMVFTKPLPTPVWINGRYWHRTERRAKDLLQMAILVQYLRGQCNPPIEIWEEEVASPEIALATVRAKLL